MFGCAFYLTGKARFIAPVLLLLIGGPIVIVLFPIWLMGYGVFLFQKRQVRRPTNLALAVMLAGSALAALILVAPKVRASIPFHTALTGNRNLLADYFEGIAFSIHLLFLLPVIHRFRSLLLKVAVITGWLASLTFAMYLFHRPLIQLFAASHSGTVSSWPKRILVLGLTFAIIATLGRWCEGQKHRIKAGLFAYFGEEKRVPAEVLT